MKTESSFLEVLLFVTLVFTACFPPVSSSKQYDAVVKTSSGPVRGFSVSLHSKKTITKFLGIPFARVKRFHLPESPEQWNETFKATKFGNACPQPSNLDVNTSSVNTSEDCLFINVFVPGAMNISSEVNPLRAVLVWIHGGGFLLGAGGLRKYDGSFLATEGDVIVVTFNYRLGLFGFLWADGVSRNLGMHDQLKALTWVKENIQSFGGDPEYVTLFGESAGARSVALHLLSPLSKGLYQRAILESGTALGSSSTYSNITAEKVASAVMGFLDCPEELQLRDCLANQTTEEILDAQRFVTNNVIDLFNLKLGPAVDGNYLPDYPAKLMEEGKLNKKDVIIGVNRDEASLWLLKIPAVSQGIPGINEGLNKSEFHKRVYHTKWIPNQDSRTSEAIIFQYTNWSDPDCPQAIRQQFVNAMSDAIFKAPTVRSADIYSRNGLQVYLYSFEHRGNYSRRLPLWTGVYHTAEIGYVFGWPLLDLSERNNAEVHFSRRIMNMWANFSKTGNPSQGWPSYTSGAPKYAVLDLEYSVKSRLLPDKMVFWNKYLPTQQRLAPPPTPARIVTTPPASVGPTKPETRVRREIVDALIAVTVTMFVALLVMILCCCQYRRKLFLAESDTGPTTRLI